MIDMQIDISDFQCLGCNECCRQPGYVRISNREADLIAEFLSLDVRDFVAKFTRLTKDRASLSLIDRADKSCIFLTRTGCLINQVKPGQCRDFPHKWRFSGFTKICGWAKLKSNKNKGYEQ